MSNEKRAEMFRLAGEACLRVADEVHDARMSHSRDVYGADKAALVFDYQSDDWYDAYRKYR